MVAHPRPAPPPVTDATDATHPPPGGRVADAQIVAALRASHGIIAEAARAVGMTRTRLSLRVNRSPRLQAVRNEAREALKDRAEGRLYDLIEAGDPAMIRWFLATQGRDRGYGPQIAHRDGAAVEILCALREFGRGARGAG